MVAREDPRDFRSDLAAAAGGEAARLTDVIAGLERDLAQAEAEAAVVTGWPADRIATLRTAMRMPRYADVEGVRAELALAAAELEAVQDLRRRLRDQDD
jgi:hypothetical protein